MRLLLLSRGQQQSIVMEQAGDQKITVGEYQYRLKPMAARVRKLATKMWGKAMSSDILDYRLCFEADLDYRSQGRGDSGSFSQNEGSIVMLGRWDEQGSIAIALHELAHEMHARNGGYLESDGVIRESLAILAERETGFTRQFEREPYYTADNLIEQLSEMSAFRRQAFTKRWDEVVTLTSDAELADLINYYLDRSERLGFERWLKRYHQDPEVRDILLQHIAQVSLRYSLEYRRTLIKTLVRCPKTIELRQLIGLLDAIVALDRRYPQDDLDQIIRFCFAPVIPARRFAFAGR